MIFFKAPKVIKALKDLNDFGGRRPKRKQSRNPFWGLRLCFYVKPTATILGSRGWLWPPYGLRP